LSELTRLSSARGIAVITIDNPPVNALGAEVTGELFARLGEIERDPLTPAVVIIGANGTFSGGADIRGFGKPPPPGPTLRDVIGAIEGSRKPFVAALEGNALGGGLELAMACDYRIARPATRVGQPEIKLGLLPGAGGTQRLPRLVGLGPALEMIVGGEPIGAQRAQTLGLIDAIVEGDVLEGAVAFAHEYAGEPRRRTSQMKLEGDPSIIEAARAKAEPKARGGLAAHNAIDAVAAALRLPFEEALRRERALFEELLASEQSKARIHVFFAEREASKLPGIPKSEFRARTATVIGGGTMGVGITMTLANAGIAVTMVDLEPALLERARNTIEGNYGATLKKGRLSQSEMDARLGRIRYATELAAAADVDLVIEAVFEEMDVKKDVFRKLDGIARPGTMLATNTSTLDIDALAEVTSRPGEVVGTHFFSPANVMRLLEIVRGARTEPKVIADALALSKQLGKIGVVAGNCDGFIGNRMLLHYKREADFLLEEGAAPQQVDRVIKDFGFPMGPFAMFDLAGIDVSWRIRKRRLAEKPVTGRYSKLEDRLCELGRFGQKTGMGFYRYESGDRTPHPDPFVENLIRTLAREAGIVQRQIGDDEILKRCIYPLINEAANILADGTAARPGDVDVVWVYGYGFPAFRGGPLRYADSVGLRTIYDEMLAFEREHGAYWMPSPLLAELATSGGSFGKWQGTPQWAMR
jgi:3-hydroxyacyl-CoA dehydrogenase